MFSSTLSALAGPRSCQGSSRRFSTSPDSPDLHGLARRLRRGDDRLDREVEWDAEDVGILAVEESSSLRS
jgi:hypothetical protein